MADWYRPVWQMIGVGVDARLTELEGQFAQLTAAHEQAERELGASRARIAQLESDLADAERGDALAEVEGRPSGQRGKVVKQLEAARRVPPELEARVRGLARAVQDKRGELETHVVGNVETLIAKQQPRAEAAAAAITEALDQLTDAVAGWLEMQRQSVRLVSKVQGLSGQHVPDLPLALTSLITDPIDVPVPVPRIPRQPFAVGVDPLTLEAA